MESPFWNASQLVGSGGQLKNFRVARSLEGRAHIRERNDVNGWRSRKSRGTVRNKNLV